MAYTGRIATEFNKAVREFHQNSHKFQFKSFHYYLTRALQILATGNCYTVYRGCGTKFYYSGRGNVHFGQFTSSSPDEFIATSKYLKEGGTLFIIKNCLSVNITAFSMNPNEMEVLIPGCEVYQEVTVQNTD